MSSITNRCMLLFNDVTEIRAYNICSANNDACVVLLNWVALLKIAFLLVATIEIF